MNFKNGLKVLVLGMAIFSMFFGGGNLIFPLWIGSTSSSTWFTSLGFILSGVLLPFYGVMVTLYFKGRYEESLSICGKTLSKVLIFLLLLFWIPLGSGPRCNQLAYGAYFCQMGGHIPLWVYSILYSGVVYFLTVRKNRIIEILGNVITPVLLVSLFFLIFSAIRSHPLELHADLKWKEFYLAFLAGYNTMDFIAAIFFSSTIIFLIEEKQKNKFDLKLVRNACVVAVVLLSLIYIGMISVGYAHSEILKGAPRDQVFTLVGNALFAGKFQALLFLIITLSVLSTSMALTLVFSNYLKKEIFKEKLSHSSCLIIVLAMNFLMSILGFEKLATLISWAMSVLYPVLLIVTTIAFSKKYYISRKYEEGHGQGIPLGQTRKIP